MTKIYVIKFLGQCDIIIAAIWKKLRLLVVINNISFDSRSNISQQRSMGKYDFKLLTANF